jgi:hypothetical protein
MKGGARKGAGRKPTGRTGVLTNFYLSRATVAQLRRVPSGQRSKFVEAAIVAAIASKNG